MVPCSAPLLESDTSFSYDSADGRKAGRGTLGWEAAFVPTKADMASGKTMGDPRVMVAP